VNSWSDEETDKPARTSAISTSSRSRPRTGRKHDRMLFADNNHDKAREIFAAAVKQNDNGL
jgi:hypothetical protein